jgi:hypothetical protein
MKLYSHDEMLNRVLGSKNTPARNAYEQKIYSFLKRKKTLIEQKRETTGTHSGYPKNCL